LATKKKAAAQRKLSTELRIESSPYFALVVFALLLLALVWLFSDFVFSDKMLHGSDTLQAGYFYRTFFVDYVREHLSVPQWDPYIFGGIPFVEAFHGDIFYPLSVMKFFGPLKRMLGWNLFLHVFLAGIFMYFAARQFKLSKTAALFSAACYMFAGYLISFVAPGHDGKMFVTALFPLVILFLDRGFERKPFLNFSLMGLVIGLIVLTPHPQMSYFTLWAAALYMLFKLIVLFRTKKSVARLFKPAALSAYAVIIGLLLSAIQFYPGYYYTSHFSPRADTKKGWDWATSWSMHEEEAASLLIPEFCGTSSRSVQTVYWGKNVFKDNSEAVGAVTIFVALIGLLFYRRKESYFFGGLALFALSYALAGTTPLFKLYFYLIPKVDSMRAASMIIFLFSFSAALLAGMGIQFVRDRAREISGEKLKRFYYLLFGFPAGLFLLAFMFSVGGRGMLSAWTSLFYSDAATTMIRQNMSKLDLAFMNLPAIQSGFWLAFLFTALVALGIWIYRSGRAGTWILLALLAVPVIDGVRFNSRFISVVDSQVYSQNFEANAMTRFLDRQPGKFRVMNPLAPEGNNLPHQGIEIPLGYHGNQLRWYDNLVGDLRRANLHKPRFLNLVGSKYLIKRTEQKIPAGYFGELPLTTAASFGSVEVLQNDNALPRVYLVDRYKIFEDRMDIYPPVIDGSDDLRRVVYLEEEPGITIITDSSGSDSINADSAWIVDYAVDSIVVGVSCTSNRILVFTDVFFDAWQVFIDGQPAELLRAYGAFRAVAIPSGSAEVLFRFESSRYRTGRMVTGLTSLYLLLIFGFYALLSKRKSERKNDTKE